MTPTSQRRTRAFSRRRRRSASERKSTPSKGKEAALSNAELAELLAREAENANAPLNRAFRRASRRAFFWPEEASVVLASGRSLTELQGIGPYLKKIVAKWLSDRPAVPEPPPVRAGFLALTEAQSILDSKAEWLPSINGDLQMHTLWSDGTASIEEMASAAVERKYEYIAITDHAKTLKIAGGIEEDELRKQANEIEEVNGGLARAGKKLRVLRSIELNLNPRGEGDMDERALAKLDIAIGCFHSSPRRKEDQTERYLNALRNPNIQILAHPRSRIYNYRLGLSADWPRVLALAAQLDKAVEIDAYPDRQDLSPDLLALARQAGCRISFGTDSHGPSQLRFMVFAAASALRVGISGERILNFMTCVELLDWVQSVRKLRD